MWHFNLTYSFTQLNLVFNLIFRSWFKFLQRESILTFPSLVQ